MKKARSAALVFQLVRKRADRTTTQGLLRTEEAKRKYKTGNPPLRLRRSCISAKTKKNNGANDQEQGTERTRPTIERCARPGFPVSLA